MTSTEYAAGSVEDERLRELHPSAYHRCRVGSPLAQPGLGALGGMDPALPLLRDDIDLGWRTNRYCRAEDQLIMFLLHHWRGALADARARKFHEARAGTRVAAGVAVAAGPPGERRALPRPCPDGKPFPGRSR